MRVLLVEDHSAYAGLVQRELQARYSHEVTMATDPILANRRLEEQDYEVVVVDVLYEPLIRDFNTQRLARKVMPTSGRLLLSGLSVLRASTGANRTTKTVVWTSGETNRYLHILFAHEELGVRAFCSKTAGSGTIDSLHKSIVAAATGNGYVDQLLNPYLPADDSVPLRRTILREDSRRAIWRAMALGYHSRKEVSRVTGYSERHVGNMIPLMVSEDLQLLDPGLRPGKSPLNELIQYAARNWEFLLDDTVREMYP